MNTGEDLRAPALEQLLGGMDASRFLAEHWLQRPLVRPGGAAALVSLASSQKVERWVAEGQCDLLCVRDGQVVAIPSERSAETARALLADGVSLALRHPNLHDAELASLGRALAGELMGMLNLHVYCTPAGRGSFGWHHDPEEVFIVQTAGRKRYVLRENTVRRWPVEGALGGPAELARETSAAMEVELAAGDVLYIPAGWWHTTHAVELSLSVSVGLLLPSPLALLDFVRAELARDERWRQRLPGLGRASTLDDAARMDACRTALGELTRALTAAVARPELPLRFLASWWMAGLTRGR